MAAAPTASVAVPVPRSRRAQAGMECWRFVGSGASPSQIYYKPVRRQSYCGGRDFGGVQCRVVPNSTTASQTQVRKQPAHSVDSEEYVARGRGARSEQRSKEHALSRPVQAIVTLVDGAKQRLLNKLMDMVYTETDDPPNRMFLGNFAPVPEISGKTPVQVVSGVVPSDFPPGVYIRNGPNPQFGGKAFSSPLGVLDCHMFEGDGMLHATYFGEGGHVSYLNRYVVTETYEMEKRQGRRAALPSFDGDSQAILLAYLFNTLRFGKPNKVTCNTHVFEHAGKYYAVAEGDLPYEFNLSDLSTVGVWHGCYGRWKRPFSAHPLHDRETKELVIFGVSADKPYAEIGIVSTDGERMVQNIDLQLDHCTLCHEISITESFNIFFDFPLILSKERLMKGGRIMEFQEDDVARIGVLPRYGNAESIKWFTVQNGFSWHKFNSFEDGDEVVVRGLRARRPIIPSPMHMDKLEWWTRGVQPTSPLEAKDPSIDGALCSQLHEWRFNMVTGESSERHLSGSSPSSLSGEYPVINRSYAGIKNKYGYMCLLDVEGSVRTGMGKMNGFVKITFPESVGQDVKVETHQLGSMWGASEPSFVARLNAQAEDDGWIITYVHDEVTSTSYLYIIDAQNFSGEPVAKLQLPQRVPYGFHGTFFYDHKKPSLDILHGL